MRGRFRRFPVHFDRELLLPDSREMSRFLALFPERTFEKGEVLIRGRGAGPRPPRPDPRVGFVIEGLVRGTRRGPGGGRRATGLLAGDGRWFGFDALHHGENLFRYEAVVPTTAAVFPLRAIIEEAPRSVLLGALTSAGMDWCTASSLAGSWAGSLRDRVLILLREEFRLQDRPEIEVRRQDIADLLHVTRQTLHPVLRELAAEGVIDLGYGVITLL